MIGVSPAFFISSFDGEFTTRQMLDRIPAVAALGFDSFQPEIFSEEELAPWCDSLARATAMTAAISGLSATQFVAHFLLQGFRDWPALESDWGIAHLEALLQSLSVFPAAPDGLRMPVTVPLPGFEGTIPDARSAQRALAEKLRRMIELGRTHGYRIAFEIMPGALIDGTGALLHLLDELDPLDAVDGARCGSGYNFDTGHAWSRKESLLTVPTRARGRILGTHLCDNLGNENLSLGPGEGSIPWKPLLIELQTVYSGSWDIEIRCRPDDVEQSYARAQTYLKSLQYQIMEDSR